jgi:hypothetical protein
MNFLGTCDALIGIVWEMIKAAGASQHFSGRKVV